MSIFQVNEEHVKDVSHDLGSSSGLSILSVGYREAMLGRPLKQPQETASQASKWTHQPQRRKWLTAETNLMLDQKRKSHLMKNK